MDDLGFINFRKSILIIYVFIICKKGVDLLIYYHLNCLEVCDYLNYIFVPTKKLFCVTDTDCFITCIKTISCNGTCFNVSCYHVCFHSKFNH